MKTAIISLHDVSPRFNTEVKTILQHFEDLPLSLLVTPLWDGQNRLTTDFVKILGGLEKVLHGLTHYNNRQDWIGKISSLRQRSDRELFGLTQNETANLIVKSKYLFEDAFGESPTGFVPPAWCHNQYSTGLLQNMGFSYTESAWQLWDLNRKEKVKTPAICYDYGNNAMVEWFSISFWSQALKYTSPDLVRISIHPSDLENGFLWHLDQIIVLLRAKGYIFQTYQGFLKNRPCFQ
ncbi:MAG: DUF2334 domain-containing protein [Haliscomenobacter sp.]|uniref:DUF2334 domain-containing protein n=1 Tax=Haliscomenobacter sp. TaxID=2717303 RepID=UPI0029BB0205|nr:DUF2334 domain-containing protein [Haliscomenobacter sp.]MDX2067809.1 DUF2334 domain-containing protein [Haliscomenobacter sp.]